MDLSKLRTQPSEAYEALVDGIEDYAIVMLDPEGLVLSWNSGAQRIKQYDRDEILGRHFSCFYTPDDVANQVPERELVEARSSGRVKVTGQRLRKDGTAFAADVVITALYDHSGTLSGFGEITSDVTARAEAEHRFRNAMEFSPIGLGLIGLDGKWLTANRALSSMLGYTEDEFRAMSINDITAESNSSALYAQISDLIQDKIKSFQIERQIVGKDGTLFWGLQSVSMVRNERGVPQYFIGQVQDITNRKAVELELSRVSEQLRREKDLLIETAENLLEAKLAAEKANAAKTEFLTTMSHELRTPMNGILGFAQLLEAPVFGTLTGKQAEFVDAILRSGRHLLDLINDILELSKIESGKLPVSVERVALAPVMKSVLSSLSNMAEAQGITLVQGALGWDVTAVMADRVRLIQCLINLGSNAVKYNRAGGQATFDCERLDEGHIRIRVTDTGFGIPADRQHELFQPFNRLGAAASKIEGTGVGLALTARLVESMGGQVGFSSTPESGSAFWIDLPVFAADTDHTEPSGFGESAPMLALRDFSLLYAEDVPSNMDLMRNILATLDNVHLIEAVNGTSAIALAKQQRPDVIVLDLNLPDISGYDVLRSLQDSPEFAGVQFIALSASVMPSDLKRGLKAGFAHYLMKPIDIGLLKTTIAKTLAANRAIPLQ
ncbi:MAG TPA: PAS domain S-box protein [Alphaproteobacteria bacterium]|nr:PAS domain S-box protein [Alphaproteobacteria bacterium]